MKKLSSLAFLLFSATSLFADEEAKSPAHDKGAFWQTLIMIAIAILFFYFILWRPEQKRRKEMEKKRGSMKKGDKVTAMGIIGVIDRVKENSVILKMVDGAKIEVLKGAITEVAATEEGKPEEEKEETEEKK